MPKSIETSPARAASQWSSQQAYTMAVLCLVLGVALGYLFRGSGATPAQAATNDSVPGQQVQGGMPGPPGANLTPQQKQEMLAKASEPMLKVLQRNPVDTDTLVKLGNLYYDSQEYAKAIEYYERALKVQPKNADVRTDMGTAYWYTGNADKALTEFSRALKDKPNYASTLFNMGIVRWQGKMDPAGAVAAWQKLLDTNPTYPQRQQVQDQLPRCFLRRRPTPAPASAMRK
jgi:cytochrome c-type biogenesis protein CcmH/NrfG